ncbi:glycine betaine/proline transport system substrate-binding protein [Pseudorhizobium tarimense]|uniref:Glycine betaine/proline transport system substrate-binding protein n=1 Tax=Pseudorhizobium tarimense TaxID=1079109 RepID=A0ABV2H399_9HYPH|nr:glycine betaine ABC transporter substrate-binding protein [Pseudorhizobium tarimense]MCJ8518032.1 ABC transporter substrate-binding protein [Pseudorhizobium tarimense]
MRYAVAATAIFVSLWLRPAGAEAACGEVSVAEMNWGSAAIAAHIDKIILERGYDCSVTLVPGDTVPTFNAMNLSATPDMAPEFWINAVRGELTQATAANRLVIGAEILADGAVEGWWVPKYVVEANPDIRTVDDAIARPELFPAPGTSDDGAVHGCPDDWACHVTTANLFRAFEAAEKGFALIQPATAAELEASIVEAFENETGWLGYYWAPTAILGKYEMVRLSFGVAHQKAQWDECTTVPDCPSPERNAYPTSQAFTLMTEAFTEKAAPAMDYVNKRQWSNATISSVLAWQLENKASNAETAEHFIEQYEDVWSAWVAPAVAGKVKRRP